MNRKKLERQALYKGFAENKLDDPHINTFTGTGRREAHASPIDVLYIASCDQIGGWSES